MFNGYVINKKKYKIDLKTLKLNYNACLRMIRFTHCPSPLFCYNISTVWAHTEAGSVIQHTYKLQVRINASVSITTTISLQGWASG